MTDRKTDHFVDAVRSMGAGYTETVTTLKAISIGSREALARLGFENQQPGKNVTPQEVASTIVALLPPMIERVKRTAIEQTQEAVLAGEQSGETVSDPVALYVERVIEGTTKEWVEHLSVLVSALTIVCQTAHESCERAEALIERVNGMMAHGQETN
jgi:hypothetical protein